jgi:hypothetical protein
MHMLIIVKFSDGVPFLHYQICIKFRYMIAILSNCRIVDLPAAQKSLIYFNVDHFYSEDFELNDPKYFPNVKYS